MCEPDSEHSSWGMDIFDVDGLFSCCKYYGDSNQQQYTSDGYYETPEGVVDTDDRTAHALPEEFSRLSVIGAAESLHGGDEYLQGLNAIHEYTPTGYYPGYMFGPGETEEVGPSSSCSSPGDRSHDGEDYSYDLEIKDESELDGEVGKRLNLMIPVPHVPRINGDIPSLDEATSDHQRLLDRLELFQLVEHKVAGDGNCQFRALSDQFYRVPDHHEFVRQQVVDQLKAHPEIYEGYVPMAYSEYLKRMSMNGEWGDHVTLQAAADSYGVKIVVLTSFKDTYYIEILPKVQKSKRVICLSFWSEVHYNSVYPEGDLPLFDSKKKKKWWSLRNKS